MANGFESFGKGLEQGQALVSKMVDVERKREELKAKQDQIKIAKFDGLMGKVNGLLSIDPKNRKMRELTKRQVVGYANAAGIPLNPDVVDVINDPEMHLPVMKAMSSIMQTTDPDKRQQMADPIMAFFGSDAPNAIMNLTKLASQHDMQQAKLAADSEQNKDKSLTDILDRYSSNDVTKRTNNVRESWNKIQAGAAQIPKGSNFENLAKGMGVNFNPSGAKDVTLLFNFMKMNDPNSVVRESEFKTAVNVGPYSELLQRAFEQFKTGQLLTPSLRNELVQASKAVFVGQMASQKEFDDKILREAVVRGVDPKRLQYVMADQVDDPAVKKRMATLQRIEAAKAKLKSMGYEPKADDSAKSRRKDELKGK